MIESKDVQVLDLMELCESSQVAPGCALKVKKDDLTLAVFNIDDEFYVTNDLCTHGPGSLSEGFIEGDIVECEIHNGAFNIRTGEAVAPPCTIPLRTYPVQIMNGKVFIHPNEPASACPRASSCNKVPGAS